METIKPKSAISIDSFNGDGWLVQCPKCGKYLELWPWTEEKDRTCHCGYVWNVVIEITGTK